MEIVHLVSSGQLGGTEASVIEMVTGVLEMEPSWRVGIVTPERGPFEHRLTQRGCAVQVLEFPRRFASIGETGRTRGTRTRLGLSLLAAFPGVVAYRSALGRVLGGDGHAPDVVHAHGFKMQVLGAVSLPARARLIWHLHDYLSGRPVSARLLRRLSSRVSLMVANSGSVAADVARICGTRVPIETMYNGVDLTIFTPGGTRLDLDACGGVAPPSRDTLRIGLVGTFGLWKGHRTLLRAIASLRSQRPVRAYLIGGAQYQTHGSQISEASLRADAATLGIADRVVFTGPVIDPAAAMRALDIVVHASTQPEPFGMVIAEAMACGRAVVISGAGGAAELVTDGADGLTHGPGDEAGLAACLQRLADDDRLRARLGVAARETAERRFDRRRLARQLVPVYRRLAGSVA